MAIEISKGTLFVDIDGTILDYQTKLPLPYSVEKINKAYEEGYMIVITTQRGDLLWGPDSPFCRENTLKTLREIGVKWHNIIWDSSSPRTIINDEGVHAIHHLKNGSWENYEF